jgi:3-phosphoshikimate 1-carboxyvinyltransferase
LAKPPSATVTVPGSKSITTRALVLAALSDSTASGCTLTGVLRSEDTEVMLDCLGRLGLEVRTDWDRESVTVRRGGSADYVGDDDWIPNGRVDLFVGNSGTTIRFLTAMLALGEGTYRLDGIPRMRERPIQDLLDALGQLGVDARSELGNGCPPVVINANGLHGGRVRVRAEVSSQFLSGLMLACPFARGDTTLEIDGPLVSEPYVEMTIAMLQRFGLKIAGAGPNRYDIPGQQRQNQSNYAVEPDASSASYFLAAAAITGGTVGIQGLTTKSIQGDVRFLDILEDMGCTAYRGHDSVAVTGGMLRGIDVDMNDISDTVMTLAAVACFAEGPTTIRNVAHIRHKETDRIAALATELRKLGAEVDERADGLSITPRPLRGCAVDTYNDHRMAMSLALIGLKVPGVVIRDPGCVAKTYPGFWQDLEKLRN